MTRKIVAVLVTLVVTAAASAPANAQGFGPGSADVGPTIGLGGIGSASIAIGGRFETAVKTLPSLNDGVLGIQVSVDYYSWSSGPASLSYIPFGATANYHFVLDDPKIDPFVGAGLGYSVVSCDLGGGFGESFCSSSAIYFIGRAGARYYFQNSMAAYADVGAGAATLNVGLMFKVK